MQPNTFHKTKDFNLNHLASRWSFLVIATNASHKTKDSSTDTFYTPKGVFEWVKEIELYTTREWKTTRWFLL